MLRLVNDATRRHAPDGSLHRRYRPVMAT